MNRDVKTIPLKTQVKLGVSATISATVGAAKVIEGTTDVANIAIDIVKEELELVQEARKTTRDLRAALATYAHIDDVLSGIYSEEIKAKVQHLVDAL